MAALYNAEATARGIPSMALSAGLTNRRETPPTMPFLVEAVAQEVPDRPAVYAAMAGHVPRPLSDLPFVAVDGVSYLYDPARKRKHLAQDTKAVEAWLRSAPSTPRMSLAIPDSGYQIWEQSGRPALDSQAGRLVVSAYRRDVVVVRALVNTLLAATAAQPTSAHLAPTPTRRIVTPLAKTAPAASPAAPIASESEAKPPRRQRNVIEVTSPKALERAEVLGDVRAWLRAALPTGRAVLVRYGLWERAEAHFGSWNEAVQAAGIPVAEETLWALPARDPELSFDILVEALPNAVVARLCAVTIQKAARRRRDNGAPDPARQLHRRIVATGQLGVAADEAIAAQLGITANEVAKVREQEALADAT